MESNRRATVWIVVAAVLALLVGCAGGALAGGAVGYAIGQRSARAVPPAPPAPEVHTRPELPDVPLAPEFEFPLMAGGALVTQVVPGSPADTAGIQAGDLITALDGFSLAETRLSELMAGYAPGDLVTATITRGQRQIEIGLRLGTHPERANAPWIGIYYQEMPARQFERPAP
jgi:S1-C subfamily serine protease